MDGQAAAAADEYAHMVTLLEQYLAVFTSDSTLHVDLASVLGEEWLDAVSADRSVLTPHTLHEALRALALSVRQARAQAAYSAQQRARFLLVCGPFVSKPSALSNLMDHVIQSSQQGPGAKPNTRTRHLQNPGHLSKKEETRARSDAQTIDTQPKTLNPKP